MEAPEVEAVLRAMIANRVVSETGKSGFRAAIIRALFDNSEPLVVWRGPEGIEYGPAAPQGTATKSQPSAATQVTRMHPRGFRSIPPR